MKNEARAWIPPVPLALGVLSIVASWLLVFVYASTFSFDVALAWIHTLALGGFSTIALAVLVHAIPAFTDLPWRAKAFAKAGGFALPFAAAGLAASFFFTSGMGVRIFATLAFSAVACFSVPALLTLTQRAAERTEAAIARAMALVIVLLLLTGFAGAVLGEGYASGNASILRIAPAHAALGVVGWLTLLTMGVSARTLNPLLGAPSRFRIFHIVSNSGMALAAILGIVGLLFAPPLFIAACAIGTLAAVAYTLDALHRVIRASTPQRPVHAWIVAAMLWLVFAGLCLLRGDGAAAVVAALGGWIYGMVFAHLHHIAIRVMATIVRGPDDETPPWELLRAPLSWVTFAFGQAAAVLLTFGAAEDSASALRAAAAAGFAAIAAYGANLVMAVRRARTLRFD